MVITLSRVTARTYPGTWCDGHLVHCPDALGFKSGSERKGFPPQRFPSVPCCMWLRVLVHYLAASHWQTSFSLFRFSCFQARSVPEQPNHVKRAALVPCLLDIVEAWACEERPGSNRIVDQRSPETDEPNNDTNNLNHISDSGGGDRDEPNNDTGEVDHNRDP